MFLPDNPVSVKLLDVERFIQLNRVGQVISHTIYDTSSNTLSEGGLFSEKIFGELGSPERLTTFGFINLNTSVLQPLIYKNLVKLASIYEDIIEGKAYAIFDIVKKDFILSHENHPNAGTGFTFFMSKVKDIEFSRNDSITRSDRIDIIEKYKNIAFIQQMIVEPAGLRDINEEDGGRLAPEDINALYRTLLSYSSAIPPGVVSPIYDSIRLSIQKKVVEIYEYIENILTEKKGFLQGKYGRRQLALGTRNVITTATYSTLTPDDPQYLKPEETKIGLYQTMKGLQPIVIHWLRTAFLNPIFQTDANTVALTNPDTFTLEYRELNNTELGKFNTNKALESWISKFSNEDIRGFPVTVIDTTYKKYYLYLVYDTGTEITLFRSITDLENLLGKKVDRKLIHPLTWVEMFYIVTQIASQDKHALITRYPVIGEDSVVATKVHLATTSPARIVYLRDAITGELTNQYPEYPILKNSVYIDSTVLHGSRLLGLGADHDGDTVSVNFILSEEANLECHNYIYSKQALVSTRRSLLIGGSITNIGLSLYNLSHL